MYGFQCGVGRKETGHIAMPCYPTQMVDIKVQQNCPCTAFSPYFLQRKLPFSSAAERSLFANPTSLFLL